MQQIFVKHGSFYVRVHPCRVQLQSPSTSIIPQDQEIVPSQTGNKTTVNEINNESEAESEGGADSIDSNSGSDLNNVKPNTTTHASNLNEGDTQSVMPIQRNYDIRFKTHDDTPWIEAIVLNRAGKASGKNRNWWNIEQRDGEKISIDVSKMPSLEVIEKDSANEPSDEVVFNEEMTENKKQQEIKAKERELKAWQERGVYKEVDNIGQNFMSLRWVLTQKLIDNKPTIKVRLCARGFDETQDFRTDSPTCSREGLRIVFCVITSKKWQCNSLDVKTAFLQGKELEREVLVKPTREAKTDKLWHLQKCAYGLADASHYWFLKIKEELCKLGGKPSQFDQGLFYFRRNGSLIGVISLLVDDLLWVGAPEFKSIIEKLKLIFQIGLESERSCRYIGINISQDEQRKTITINQKSYAKNINKIELLHESDCQRLLCDKELTSYRATLGQLNWLANISRPDISFQVSYLSSKIQNATVSDAKDVNKLIKFVKNNQSSLKFTSIMNPQRC